MYSTLDKKIPAASAIILPRQASEGTGKREEG
jgi:hypothetical protein